METTKALSANTELNDRVLWYDGDSTIDSQKLEVFLAAGVPTDHLFVDTLTSDIRKFNQFVSPQKRIKVKTETRELNFGWNLPEEYASINVREYVEDRLWDVLEDRGWIGDGMTKAGVLRIMRTKMELDLYEQIGLTDVLRTLIYIINTLQSNNIVWGVGRGSSVSSYVLYLIGVHDVDSVEYDLDIKDFLRNE